EGSASVWRTRDFGGDPGTLEANCAEFTELSTKPGCGDFVRVGPSGATTLGAAAADYRGTTRGGGNVAALARGKNETGTLWAATTSGRVFVSKNADASDPAAVTFTRIDALAPQSPGRFPSRIVVDPSDPDHAWISYSGYEFATPGQPGHVFEV